MAAVFTTTRRVAFAETDMAGIVHFSQFFRYMEDAEHAFLRSRGLSVHATVDGRTISWPRVEAHCEYKRPLRFEDEVRISIHIDERRAKTMHYRFEFDLADTTGQVIPIATGRLTTVCVAIDEAGAMRSIAIPDAIVSKLMPTDAPGAIHN